MSLHTPLFDVHKEAGGKLVEFAGWQLPVHYGSQVDEHHAVRKHAGMFDVSHMTIVDVTGSDARAWLRRLLTNDVAKLSTGRSLYSCLCNETGGVIDDLIVTCLGEGRYRMVVNAATRDKDLAWFDRQLNGDVTISQPEAMAMLAVQGPEAVAIVDKVLTDMPDIEVDLSGMARFSALETGDWMVARTGYTGEDGVEITLPGNAAVDLWQRLAAAGVAPAGLGARDTLRLEAGLSLYGNELDEEHSPVAAGLGWTIDLSDESRDFIGREICEDHKLFGAGWFHVGLQIDGRGVLRGDQEVQLVGRSIGRITSGGFSPTLQTSVGMARVSKEFKGSCDVMIRGKPVVAHRVALPFVKHSLPIF